MLEAIVLVVFAAGLLLCLAMGLPVFLAILFGYLIFFGYGLFKKVPASRLAAISAKGILSVKNILITFLLIGMLTAVWRGSGTIAAIICASTGLMSPALIVLLCFWLCGVVSLLTGTAFGTAATMGVICMSIANVMGVPPAFSGGAILSGVYVGDRCSPMSTGAQLVCGLTGTDIYCNMRRMMKTCVIPFLLSSVLYLALGFLSGEDAAATDVIGIFRESYRLGWVTLLPALVTVLFTLLKLNVKITMLTSILVGGAVCIFVQEISPTELVWICLRGFQAETPALAALSNGGGIVSMLNVCAIVCVSSTYAGLFSESGLLNNTKGLIRRLTKRINPFGAITVVSAIASTVCCNQTLTVIMTNQLCSDIIPDHYDMAAAIEDSAVVIAPLIPWSIAAAVPLTSIGAPLSSILLGCYLYLIPLCDYLVFSTGKGFATWGAKPAAGVAGH